MNNNYTKVYAHILCSERLRKQMEMKYDLTEFEQGLQELGITLEQSQMDAFLQYYELLVEWNSFMNLTAITEFKEVCIKHFLDSLSLIKVIDCHQELKVIEPN